MLLEKNSGQRCVAAFEEQNLFILGIMPRLEGWLMSVGNNIWCAMESSHSTSANQWHTKHQKLDHAYNLEYDLTLTE